MFALRLARGVLAFLVVSFYGVWIALTRGDKRFVARDYAHRLAARMDAAFGLHVTVHGAENMQRERPCIYIANHQSLLDVAVLARLFPGDTVVIAKESLRWIPFFGWLFHVTGNVYIDRSNRGQAVGRLQNAADAIRERGVSVWIFPEGTRGKTPGKLLPFKKGAFHMAVVTGVPLVPIVVSPLDPLWDLKRGRIRPGHVEVHVLAPIPTHGLTARDVPALIERTHFAMAAALREAKTTPLKRRESSTSVRA